MSIVVGFVTKAEAIERVGYDRVTHDSIEPLLRDMDLDCGPSDLAIAVWVDCDVTDLLVLQEGEPTQESRQPKGGTHGLPAYVGVVWTTSGGLLDEITVYADPKRAEEAYLQWWADDGVDPDSIEDRKADRLHGATIDYHVVEVNWEGHNPGDEVNKPNVQVVTVPASEVLEIAKERGYPALSEAGAREVAWRVALHFQESVEQEIAYALDAFEEGN